MSQDTIQKKTGLGLAFKRVTQGAAAVGGVALLTLGTAFPAQALSGPIQNGHVDVVSINSLDQVGSEFDNYGGFFGWPLANSQDIIEFTNPASGTKPISCVGGVYTIVESSGSAVPNVGFNNESDDADYNISLTSSTGTAKFEGDHGFDLFSNNVPETLYFGDHDHGEWELTGDSRSCDATRDFTLSFSVVEDGTVTPVHTQTFTFRVTL